MFTKVEDMTVSRKVFKEAVMPLCGPAMILLQIAYAPVAQGAEHHSNFTVSFTKRLARFFGTMDFVMAMVFGSDEDKSRWIERLNSFHKSVRGISDDPELPPESAYDANDPELQLWVLGALVYVAVGAYETFVGALSPEEKDLFLSESISWGVHLKIPRELAMRTYPSYAHLEAYIQKMIVSGKVCVTKATRTLAQSILYPVPYLPHFFYGPYGFLGWHLSIAAFLPEKIRAGYELVYGTKERLLFECLITPTIRTAMSHTPGMLRTNPFSWRVTRQLWSLFGV
jgi:uncharacterized protein (DUF2236 family)